jgi:hypothetical protein
MDRNQRKKRIRGRTGIQLRLEMDMTPNERESNPTVEKVVRA